MPLPLSLAALHFLLFFPTPSSCIRLRLRDMDHK